MLHHSRLLILPVSLALLAAGNLFALPFPPEKEKWTTMTVDEFHVFSNASDRQTQQIVTNLLRMREAVGKVTHLKVRSPLPMYVYVHRNEKSFGPYRDALFQRHQPNVTGVFVATDSANFVLLQGDAESGAERVVYHELTHYFVRNTVSGLPLWFDEGLAEYYSTFATHGNQVSIGKPVHEHVNLLRDGNVMPLEQLFAMSGRSPGYSEERRQGIFYAQSWALLHYLLAGNEERSAQIAPFLGLLNSGKPLDEAFRAAFHTSYAEMEKELRYYIRKPAMKYVTYSLSELQVPPVPESQPMTRDDVLYALGNLLANGSAATGGDAEEFLKESVRLNPEHAAAHAALGFVYERTGNRPAATAHYDKAVATGSGDAEVYIAYGTAILDRLEQSSRGPGGASAADVARARQLFERAVQLDPASPRAHAGLGATYVTVDGDPAPGIASLEKSLLLAPGQEPAAFNLIQLYAKAARRADAQRVFDAVLAKSSDPELVRQGAEAVLLADFRAAENLMAAGKIDEALPLLRSLVKVTTNDRLKAHVEQILARADEDAALKQQTDAVESALEKARAGNFADALKIVDDILPNIKEERFREYVQKLRGDLAKAARQ